MISITALRLGFACSFLAWGCVNQHEARVQTALLPPPVEAPVRHTGRLWVELGDATWEAQCRLPQGQRELCFRGVRGATFGALSRALWTTFSDVTLRGGETLAPGDYLLTLDVSLNALPPGADGPGWSAVASGGYRLVRDGEILLEEKLGSRSRPAFAYGSALGRGAGEVVDALAIHIAEQLGHLPEPRPLRPAPLPAVVAERSVTPAPIAKSPKFAPSTASPSTASPSTASPSTASPSTPFANTLSPDDEPSGASLDNQPLGAALESEPSG